MKNGAKQVIWSLFWAFSGTPYLEKPEPVFISENVAFKFTQITNTVYYYPLVTAIKQFLKTPIIKTG